MGKSKGNKGRKGISLTFVLLAETKQSVKTGEFLTKPCQKGFETSNSNFERDSSSDFNKKGVLAFGSQQTFRSKE